jgi:hypothetical protein
MLITMILASIALGVISSFIVWCSLLLKTPILQMLSIYGFMFFMMIVGGYSLHRLGIQLFESYNLFSMMGISILSSFGTMLLLNKVKNGKNNS